MFGDKSLVTFSSKNPYRKQRQFFTRYDRFQPEFSRRHRPHPQQQHHQQHVPNVDLRLIVLRHAERIDVMLGENWYQQIFGGALPAPTQSYQHPLLPYRLPHRQNTLLYVFDPPITRSGQQKSVYRGNQLASYGLVPDYCYSSPACRSVMTATGILQGTNRSQVPLRLEPVLFEPMNWNTPFKELPNVSPFMSSGDWIQNGYNVDQRYRRVQDYLNPLENEYDFFARSQKFFQSIVQRHDRNHEHPANILIVGHAASPLIFETIAQQQPFNAEQFGQNCANISYLHAAVLERNAITRVWSIQHLPPIV